MQTLPFFTKLKNTNDFNNLAWNLPEQKSGTINLVGGHSGGFFAPVQAAEYLSHNFPIKTVNLLLPDALKNKLPAISGSPSTASTSSTGSPAISPLNGSSLNPIFLPSTDSGSLAKSDLLSDHFKQCDFTILIGDLSKNSATTIAISEAIKQSATPVLITRDGIDLLLPEMSTLISREDLFVVGSLAQIQKLFRSVYYPKMILLSQPLLPIVEALHKFTLSHPTTILTFHNDQIITASQGEVLALPLEATVYSGQPIRLWSGDLACRIAALNLFNPHQKLPATTLATTYQPL